MPKKPKKIASASASASEKSPEIKYIQYSPSKESLYLPSIRQLISNDLSEPYSIYVYRYFLYEWPDLCFVALDREDNLIGVVISKLESHRGGPLRGYIAMLAVKQEYRGRGIATNLVRMALDIMIEREAEEIALETEVTNASAMTLYERLGFLRSKRLYRYYLNGNSAFRFVLFVKESAVSAQIGYNDPDQLGIEEPPSA